MEGEFVEDGYYLRPQGYAGEMDENALPDVDDGCTSRQGGGVLGENGNEDIGLTGRKFENRRWNLESPLPVVERPKIIVHDCVADFDGVVMEWDECVGHYQTSLVRPSEPMWSSPRLGEFGTGVTELESLRTGLCPTWGGSPLWTGLGTEDEDESNEDLEHFRSPLSLCIKLSTTSGWWFCHRDAAGAGLAARRASRVP